MSVSEAHPDLSSTTADSRMGLCLSGGGFRAALFHLGALRRLNELGILSKIDTIASVSGGSIVSAFLATQLRPWPQPGTVSDAWEEQVARPFRRFTQQNIRTGPILKRLLPWNWFRPSTQVKALEATYKRRLTSLTLSKLPARPTFVFCGTDMTHGVSWVFERRRVGSWRAGYVIPAPDWPLARAVAASSCFPPVFSPMPIQLSSGQLVVDGAGRPMPRFNNMMVSDGGLYDNLGLQPVEGWGTVLVSDGGAPFVAGAPTDLVARWKSYLDIVGKQSGALRKRALIKQYIAGERHGCYWGIGSAVRRYRADAADGYEKEFAAGAIARIRTDMDAFSEAEIAILENHGYLLADIATEVHTPGLIAVPTAKNIPYPEWMDAQRASASLSESHERRWFGRC